jgi:hypothetical protein
MMVMTITKEKGDMFVCYFTLFVSNLFPWFWKIYEVQWRKAAGHEAAVATRPPRRHAPGRELGELVGTNCGVYGANISSVLALRIVRHTGHVILLSTGREEGASAKMRRTLSHGVRAESSAHTLFLLCICAGEDVHSLIDALYKVCFFSLCARQSYCFTTLVCRTEGKRFVLPVTASPRV